MGEIASQRKFVSNKDESVRMFERDWMEKLSHVHPATPLVVFVPVLLFLSWSLLRSDLAPWSFAAIAMTGFVLWTLYEYLMHRFFFHFHPSHPRLERLHFIIHGVHHDYPSDSTRLVLPPGVSIPLAILHYFVLTRLLGILPGQAFFVGLMVGYLLYDSLHYILHHWSLTHPWGVALKKHHLRHHFQDDNRNYGVSSPVWDIVFGTYKNTGNS